jgi:hypothetical protein
MKKLQHINRLAFVLILSICSTALKEEDPKSTEFLSKEVARQLTAISSMAPSGNAFTEVASLTSVHFGDMAWGDYDGDGDYDVVVTGSTGTNIVAGVFTKLYKNTAGVFAEDTNNPLIQLGASSCTWGDYDNDGDIDLLLAGATDVSAVAVIYNNANGLLTAINTPLIIGATYGSCSWVDFDNDGDLDVSIVGITAVGGGAVSNRAKLYRNDGNNTFTLASANLAGVNEGDAVWADYDDDKDMDLVAVGNDDAGYLETNNGASGFSVTSMNGLSFAAAVWGDFDADGDPDLIVTGTKYNSNVGTITLYKNSGTGVLTSVGTAGITAHYSASITAGDYDNDGDLDILITGATSPSTYTNTDLYSNDGTGNFTLVSNTGLDAIFYGEAKWADYDNDGDLDLILSGANNSSYNGFTKIYRNDLNPANNKPTAPGGLTLTQIGNTLTFNWNAATDGQGGKVTYNLRVGTTPGGSELISSGSNLSSGYHLIAEPGNVQGTTSWKIQNSTANKIYWSVQSIDNSLLGGNFATEVSYTHLFPLTNLNAEPGDHKIKLTWTNPNSTGFLAIYRETAATTTPSNPIGTFVNGTTDFTDNTAVNGTQYYYYIKVVDSNNNFSTFASVSAASGIFTEVQSLAGITGSQGRNMWGDYDHDGDYDILVTGSQGITGSGNSYDFHPITKIYTNANGTLTEATGLSLAAVPYSWASWNDYDNDNDLDLLITSSLGQYASYLYKNTNGAFTDVTTSSKLLPAGGFHGWADWDNDGDTDLAVAQNNSSFTARNDRSAGFTPAFTLEGGNNLNWADYDNDGDLDFVMYGQANAYIIFNNNKGVFTKAFNLFANFGFGCAWVDVDNDGDLDLITSGNLSNSYLNVYKNSGSAFTLSNSIGTSGWMFTTLAAGDYDNDGDVDLSFTAVTNNNYAAATKIFSNDGSGNYAEVTSIQLPQVSESTSAWCDYDHDGDLDLLLSGMQDNGAIITKVFRNNLNVSNTAPSVPTSLQASVGNASTTFNWSAATDAQGGSITYNLRVGTTPGGSEILSPMADVNTGMLLTPGMGNVQLNRSWKLNLPQGTYYWSVQAIDGAYASSNFAGEQQLVVDYPTTSIAIADQVLIYGDTKSIDLNTIFSNAVTYSATTDNITVADAAVQGAMLNLSMLHTGTVSVIVTAAAASGGTNSESFLLTVSKASLQITADDKTMVYHGVTPTFTYKVTGLKLSDTESILSPATTITGPDVTSSVGSYSLTVHAGTAANYTVTSTNGTLTITKATGQVTLSNLQKTFSGLPQTPTVIVVPTGLEVDLTYDNSATAPSAVGSYQIAAIINDINYQGSATGTMVISAITEVEDTRNDISFYPNPVKDELFVKASGLEKGRLSIMNMLGQEIKSQSVENETAIIDCRSVATGMFLVIVYDENNRKVIITKAIKM